MLSHFRGGQCTTIHSRHNHVSQEQVNWIAVLLYALGSRGQYVWGKNTPGGSASGDTTDHYLNPVALRNYTNTATVGDFSANYQRDLTPRDRLSINVRHELSRYDLPNEQVQEVAGQRQTADNFETMGIISYQHTFSSSALADFRGMVRENGNDFYSNANSTPIILFQHNWFQEGYFKGTFTINRGRHQWKFGVESDNTFLNDNFAYIITDRAASRDPRHGLQPVRRPQDPVTAPP